MPEGYLVHEVQIRPQYCAIGLEELVQVTVIFILNNSCRSYGTKCDTTHDGQTLSSKLVLALFAYVLCFCSA